MAVGVPSSALAIPSRHQAWRADRRDDRSVEGGQRAPPQHARAWERSAAGRLALLRVLRPAGRVVLADGRVRVRLQHLVRSSDARISTPPLTPRNLRGDKRYGCKEAP